MWNGQVYAQDLGREVVKRYVQFPHCRNILVWRAEEGVCPSFPARPGDAFTPNPNIARELASFSRHLQSSQARDSFATPNHMNNNAERNIRVRQRPVQNCQSLWLDGPGDETDEIITEEQGDTSNMVSPAETQQASTSGEQSRPHSATTGYTVSNDTDLANLGFPDAASTVPGYHHHNVQTWHQAVQQRACRERVAREHAAQARQQHMAYQMTWQDELAVRQQPLAYHVRDPAHASTSMVSAPTAHQPAYVTSTSIDRVPGRQAQEYYAQAQQTAANAPYSTMSYHSTTHHPGVISAHPPITPQNRWSTPMHESDLPRRPSSPVQTQQKSPNPFTRLTMALSGCSIELRRAYHEVSLDLLDVEERTLNESLARDMRHHLEVLHGRGHHRPRTPPQPVARPRTPASIDILLAQLDREYGESGRY